MLYNVYNKENRWESMSITPENINCIAFMGKKKTFLFGKKIFPKILVANLDFVSPLEDEIYYKDIDLWARRFFNEIKDDNYYFDNDKKFKLPQNIIKIGVSFYANMNNIKEVIPFTFEKGFYKKGIVVKFKDGKAYKTRLLKNNFEKIKKQIEDYQENFPLKTKEKISLFN